MDVPMHAHRPAPYVLSGNPYEAANRRMITDQTDYVYFAWLADIIARRREGGKRDGETGTWCSVFESPWAAGGGAWKGRAGWLASYMSICGLWNMDGCQDDDDG